MTPSVRGRQKLAVAGLLLASAVLTGGLVGFAVGVAWLVSGLPPGGPGLLTVAAVAAVAADVAYARLGRPRPWAVGRQVPVEWSGVFSPATVACLYGSRLGVGPLTILPTWLWWAAVVAGASLGPWPSTLVGAVFAAVRVLAMLGVAGHARHAMARRMGALRALEPVTRAVSLAGAAAVVAVLWIA